jgi:hypothetical protein
MEISMNNDLMTGISAALRYRVPGSDMRLGVILTKEQMKEYEKLMEEQSEKMQRSDVQGSRGSRGGRSRGF